MYKHSPSRSQRSKGFKVRQGLQICILVAVSFWLIYQVKHSHDKKKAFEESGAKTSLETISQTRKFGGERGGGIHDPLQEKPLAAEKKDKEGTTEGNEVEEDDSKHKENAEENDNHDEEEEDQEDDDTNEVKEDDRREGEDDEIDEREQDKPEMEIEHEMDILDEERDREEVNENGNIDKVTEKENVSHAENHDHEAREEQYKGDDASSAVTHESESVSVESGKDNQENHNIKMEGTGIEDGNVANNTEEITIAKTTTGVGENKVEIGENIVSSKQDENPVSNSTTTTESKKQEETGTGLERKSIQTNDTPVMNSTEAKTDEREISTNPSLNDTWSKSNSTDIQILGTVQGESSNSSTRPAIGVFEKQKTWENTAENQKEKESDESDTGGGDVDHHGPIDDSDSTVSLEKDVRTGLDTLSDVKPEGSNDEKVAAE